MRRERLDPVGWSVGGSGLSKALAIGFALLMTLVEAGPALSTPPSPDRNAIAWDPAVRHGVLANGLRYRVMRNARPAGGVSIRLGVNAGSFDEDDEAQGAAHFVEHMAFGDGGPASEPEASFAAAGVAWGHDRNAETGLYSTLYQIDIPRADDKVLGLAFHWLRTVAEGGDFTEAETTRQRGVILAEREAGITVDTLNHKAAQRFFSPGERFLDRDPIGTPASLAAMTPQRLKAFFSRWYRPGNAVVTVVGVAPVEALEARVAETFGGWSPGPTPPRATARPLDGTPGLTATNLNEATAITTIGVCRLHDAPGRGPDDVARLRRKALTSLWVNVLKKRLIADTQDPAASMLSVEVVTELDSREIAGACLGVTPSQDRWEPALARAREELARMTAEDPSEAELEAALKEARSYYRGPADQVATRASRDLATALAANGLRDDVSAAPGEAFRAFDAAVADVTPADVRAAFNGDWSGSGPRIALTTQKPVTGAAILAAWNAKGPAAIPTPPTPAVAAASRTWAYEDFGRAGKVVRRETFHSPDYMRLTFANGVVLNFMHTDFEQNQAKVAVAFGAGRREIADSDFAAAQIGSLLLKLGGLGRHDFGAIQALFADRAWAADLHIGVKTFVLTGEGPSSGLRDQVHLLTAFVSDPGFRNIDPLLSTVVSAMYRKFDTVPALVMDQALDEAIDPGGPESLPPQSRMANFRTSELERLFKPPLTQASLQVSIVGDVSEKDAETWVAESLGALPARPPKPREQAKTTFLRFPSAPMAPIEATHAGPPERAMVGVFWPLYVATPARRNEEYALGLVAALLQDSLLRRLRDDLGKTYSPSAATAMPDDADQGYLQALVETAPADVDLARQEIEKAAAALARGDFTDAQLQAVRAPQLARWGEQARTNGYWLSALASMTSGVDTMREASDRQAAAAAITTDMVRKAAADWLSRTPVVALVRPRPAAVAPRVTLKPGGAP